jgi:hypothetical protein
MPTEPSLAVEFMVWLDLRAFMIPKSLGGQVTQTLRDHESVSRVGAGCVTQQSSRHVQAAQPGSPTRWHPGLAFHERM